MKNSLTVSPSPHIKSSIGTQKIMLDVLIALCPTFVAASIIFGFRAFILCIVCVAACVLFEFLFEKLLKRPVTIGDLSAAVTGLLLAFNLPSSIPLWIAVIGCFVAIVIVKQLFGGIGQNFANPAITARIVLFMSFTAHMSTWPAPFGGVDAVVSATPLQAISEGSALPSLLDMFLGNRAGCIGEGCILTLLLGGVYLLIKRVIKPWAPLAFIGTAAVLSLLAKQDVLYQLMSGGLVLGAVFMATDYATTPSTTKGKVIFGIGCGFITMAIRLFGNFPEGVSFSILLMNILVPFIDRFTKTKPMGAVKVQKAQ